MIEGEEIFESAQETGYRLCRARESVQTSGEESEELVFSAIWDLNVPNRLHVCLQNGQLKVFNVEDNTSERYNVMFRRYTPVFETNNQTEKRVEFHWDKMTTIPDRPNEIIFLLGISRTLMYTALPPPENNPYPEMPLLASTARGDFPGFIFGSPVMEISSHQSRITSMTVSPAGHILASGDESGNVRLLLLRLLDEISVFKQNERRRKKHTSSTIFSQFLPTYNVIIPAHDGPVYSMQWLPIFCSNRSNNVRNYALVTGSVDRSVRIWRVSCSSSTGISMTPAMVLDTLSTHVLSLNAFLYTDRYALAKINRVETFSNRATRSLSRASSFSSVFTLGGPDTDTEADQTQQVNNENAAKSIFLAAGTSVGTIYVWKLSYPDVHNAISPASVGDGEGDVKVDTTVAQPRTIVSDDGTKLYSLLQTSDRPIIHVALTAYPTVSLPLSPGLSPAGKSAQEGSGGDIVLAASDTQGVVHLYTPEKVTVHENTRDGSAFIEKRQQGRQLLELPHHPLYDEYRSKMSPTAVAAQAVAPLVRIGEQRYQSAVVACSFPPAYPNDDLPSSPLNSPLYSPLNSPSSSKAQSAAPPNQQQQQLSRWDPTAMVQRNGPLLVGIASGELNTYDSADLTSLSAGLTYEADHQAEAGFTLDSLDHRTGSAADRSDDPSVVSTDSDINASDRKALSRKSSMREKQTASAALLAAASAGDATSDSDSKDDGWETLQVSQKTVRYAPTIGGNVAAGTGEQTAARGRRSGKLATSSTFALEEEEEEECSEYPRTRPPPAPLPAVPKLAVRVPRPRQGSSSKDTATAVAAAHQSSQNQNYGRTRTRDGDDDNESATTMSVVTDTTSVASTPLPSPPQFLKNRMDSIASAQNANSHRVNPLAVPVQTFSKVNGDSSGFISSTVRNNFFLKIE